VKKILQDDNWVVFKSTRSGVQVVCLARRWWGEVISNILNKQLTPETDLLFFVRFGCVHKRTWLKACKIGGSSNELSGITFFHESNRTQVLHLLNMKEVIPNEPPTEGNY